MDARALKRTSGVAKILGKFDEEDAVSKERKKFTKKKKINKRAAFVFCHCNPLTFTLGVAGVASTFQLYRRS